MACIFGLSKDLSTQEAALQKFDRLFHGNPALMAVTSIPDQRFTDVNEAFLSRLGFTRNEVIGRTAAELRLFLKTEHQVEIGERLRREGRVANASITVRTKDGTLLEGLFYGELLQSQGTPSFLTVMVDCDRAEEGRGGRPGQ